MGYFQISAQPSLGPDSLEISSRHLLVIVGMMLQVTGADSLQCQGCITDYHESAYRLW